MCVFLTKAKLSLVEKKLVCGWVVNVRVCVSIWWWGRIYRKWIWVHVKFPDMMFLTDYLLVILNLIACKHTELFFFCRIPAKHQHSSIVIVSMLACWCKHVAQSTASKSCWNGCRLLVLFHWMSVQCSLWFEADCFPHRSTLRSIDMWTQSSYQHPILWLRVQLE